MRDESETQAAHPDPQVRAANWGTALPALTEAHLDAHSLHSASKVQILSMTAARPIADESFFTRSFRPPSAMYAMDRSHLKRQVRTQICRLSRPSFRAQRHSMQATNTVLPNHMFPWIRCSLPVYRHSTQGAQIRISYPHALRPVSTSSKLAPISAAEKAQHAGHAIRDSTPQARRNASIKSKIPCHAFTCSSSRVLSCLVMSWFFAESLALNVHRQGPACKPVMGWRQ